MKIINILSVESQKGTTALFNRCSVKNQKATLAKVTIDFHVIVDHESRSCSQMEHRFKTASNSHSATRSYRKLVRLLQKIRKLGMCCEMYHTFERLWENIMTSTWFHCLSVESQKYGELGHYQYPIAYPTTLLMIRKEPLTKGNSLISALFNNACTVSIARKPFRFSMKHRY